MDVEELVRSIDIVEYISQFVELTQKGDEWWGLSCFKDEKTPSFSVRKEPPFFYDFSSGASGNVIGFIKRYFNCSSREAVKKLQEFAGVSGEIEPPKEQMATTIICKRFAKPNKQTKACTAPVLSDNYMEKYQKRDDKLAVWEKEGISRASLDRFQVYYDGFTDRLVYPIRSLSGKIVNIGGRTLDPKWKEKRLRKYMYYYLWGKIDTIYGVAENLEYIKNAREIILFEGCKSVLLADTWGIKNTGAILTSHLSANQMKILAKLGCTVVFALDKDVNPRLDQNIEKLKRYVRVEMIRDTKDLIGDKDSPVDKGQKVFKQLYNERIVLK